MKTVILKIALGLIFCFIVFLSFGPWLDKFYTSDRPLMANDPVIDSLNYEISELKVKAEDYKDTIFGLRVDKGYTEIELNKSKGELSSLTSKYNEAKKKKDTVQLIVIADSFLNAVNESYIPLSEYVIQRANTIDSMQQVQIRNMDSIESKHLFIRRTLTDDLFNERTSNTVLRDKAKKKDRRTIFAVIGGFVIGIVTVLSLSK